MAHLSEDSQRLQSHYVCLTNLSQLESVDAKSPDVYLFWLPPNRSDEDAAASSSAFESIKSFCSTLDESAVVCVLTTPPDAARLLPSLEDALKFHLWIAVKRTEGAAPPEGMLQNSHVALIVLTRYRTALKHTKTRIAYTYCPACKKSTKDYGGKKHIYHPYGTLMSDVWNDIECEPSSDIASVVHRLQDVFGISLHNQLTVVDLRACTQLLHRVQITAKQNNIHADISSPLPNLLLNSDCLEALGNIADNSIDFCFADPPYNLNKQYDKWNDSRESVEYFAWCDTWLNEMHRVLKPGGTLAVLNIPRWAVRHYQALSSIMDYQAWIVWDALGFPSRLIMPSHYTVLCFSKGEARPLPGLTMDDTSQYLHPKAKNYCVRKTCKKSRVEAGHLDCVEISDIWSDIYRLNHKSRRADHPCQLPPLLLQRLLALFTSVDDVVLDCFNGSGTSTLVAAQMNRRYIGIEQSALYHDLISRRHQDLEAGINPFDKGDAAPATKNSLVRRIPKQKREVSKKELQLEVRRIANAIGRVPTKDDVSNFGRYKLELFEQYFASWGEVCAAVRNAGMSENNGKLAYITALDI